MSYRSKHIGPKLRRLKSKKPLLKKPLFWIIFILILLGTLSYFFLFSWFQVSKINISGNSRVQSQDLENKALSDINKKLIGIGPFNIYSKSIFLVDKAKLSQNILEKFPDIESVEIHKKLPNLINLTIKERQQFAVFCNNNNNCFSIDSNGVIFQAVESLPEDVLILRKLSSSEDFYLGQSIVDKSVVDAIYTIQQNLKDNFQIGVKDVTISDFLIFKTSENWNAYFDMSSDINSQIIKMNLLLKDQIPPGERKKLNYIYFQYKDKAYYK